MMLFWLCALALIVLALAFILPPLLGSRGAAGSAPAQSHAVNTYHSRLAALEEQHRVGALSAADLSEAKDELARALLADSAAHPTAPARRVSPRPWLAIAVGVGVPLLSIALYQRLGAPGALDPPAAAPAGEVAVEDMVARLAERMRTEPDNSAGWLLLGRSYMALERYAEAARAFSAAHGLLGDSPALLADLAEAQALMGGQNFLGPPGEHLERALQLDPALPKALWLGAFAAMQRGETALAVGRWQALLDHQPDDSEAARVLRELIANANVAGGADVAATPPADDGAAPAADDAPRLTVNVTLADHLAAGLDGSETLFVFARAAEGPPMPLAVSRRRVADLPLTVVLDDSMAMAPGMKLSDFERVVVGARISRSGTPTAGSGDLQGFSQPVPVGAGQTVNVAITEQLP
jgi:cytochrome c-type biogenesis protein CcmH